MPPAIELKRTLVTLAEIRRKRGGRHRILLERLVDIARQAVPNTEPAGVSLLGFPVEQLGAQRSAKATERMRPSTEDVDRRQNDQEKLDGRRSGFGLHRMCGFQACHLRAGRGEGCRAKPLAGRALKILRNRSTLSASSAFCSSSHVFSRLSQGGVPCPRQPHFRSSFVLNPSGQSSKYLTGIRTFDVLKCRE